MAWTFPFPILKHFNGPRLAIAPSPALDWKAIALTRLGMLLGLGAIGLGLSLDMGPAWANCPPRREPLPNLGPGDSGSDVRRLQGILALLGFYQGPTDGTYDTALANAVRLFQETQKLDPSGEVTAETWDALLPNPNCRPPTRPDR
ncbi:MAG: peptidoglycan-binding protein [Limnothrix sp. CACIAM 69d]|nr:MAG: peptidoglycan-binding protein [Limnothrix sp. CACIAM 69d]